MKGPLMITIDYNRLGIRSGHRILDMGCGAGRHVCGACARPGVTVVGADINIADLAKADEHIRIHEQYGGPYQSRWALCAASILKLPFADNSFDHVICSEVMEHISDDKQAAEELYRMLKPGGSLAVSVPRYFPERICWALSETYSNTDGGHVRIYRKKQITGLFASLGLKLTSRHWAHSLHSPYWWLKCMAGPENDSAAPVAAYHRFLTWDLMKKPKITRVADRLLNPVLGKSMVLYFRKAA
ncbi:MAG: class I SAM-dependent methyltransferase [Desulfosalsimonas sp.]|uniref:class I SAM-dependent methyltransferase n=1 Tax=Desulfosalsimonas sp. TaxID=3073848 RepID=UPI0039706769